MKRPCPLSDWRYDAQEGDGICLYVRGSCGPDYKIIAIRPYRFLILELEKL